MSRSHTIPNWLAAGLLALSGWAQAGLLTSKHTGSWYQPDQDGQGFAIEIVPGETEKEKVAVAYWYTFDENGRPIWYFGSGPVENDQAMITLYEVSGGQFAQPGNNVTKTEWGTLELNFSDCDNGQATYDSKKEQFGTGIIDLKRITNVYATVCTGSLVDDIPDQSPPVEIVQELNPMQGTGSGAANLELYLDHSLLDVIAYDIPAGDYQFMVDGQPYGTLTVQDQNDGTTRGELNFASPATAGKETLTFDPRGKTLEIVDGNQQVWLSSLLPEDDNTPDTVVGDPPPFGNARYETRLSRVSQQAMYMQASGEAQLYQASDFVEFEVEAEHLPAGTYVLRVDGMVRGNIEAYQQTGQGKIRFRYPQQSGKELLDFNPLNKLVEVLDSQGEIILSSTMNDQAEGELEDSASGDDHTGGPGDDDTDDNHGDDDRGDDDRGDDDNGDDCPNPTGNGCGP